jgi:hypothetical protein
MAHVAAQALVERNILDYEALPTTAFMAVAGIIR